MRSSANSDELEGDSTVALPSSEELSSYVNPILDADFPDPAVILRP